MNLWLTTADALLPALAAAGALAATAGVSDRLVALELATAVGSSCLCCGRAAMISLPLSISASP